MIKKRKLRKYPIGAIVGAVGQGYGFINSIAQPIKERAEEVDPNTGKFVDFRKAYSTARAGSLLDPSRIFFDQDATTGDKLKAGLGLALGGVGIGSNLMKGVYERKQDRYMKEAWVREHPQSTGQSYNPYYMARGGQVGEMAELEDGEVFQTPGGELEEVNGRTHAQGGELYNLPNGTAILGKNRSKYYNEQFKALGQKLKDSQDKHQKILDSKATPLAKRTSKLMLKKVQDEFNSLMQEQEMEKNNNIMEEEFKKGGIYIKPSHRGRFTAYKKRTGKTTEEALHSKDPKVRKMAQFAKNARKWKHPDGAIIPYTGSLTGMNIAYDPNAFSEQQFQEERNAYLNPPVSNPLPLYNTVPTMQGVMKTTPSFGDRVRMNTGNVGDVFNTAAQVAPIVGNLAYGVFGEKDKFNYQNYLNPYLSDIRSAMRSRKFNIDPTLEANRIAQAAYNYNLRQSGVGPSQLQGGLQSGATARQRSDMGVYAQANNMKNQYLADQATMDYRLGFDAANTKMQGYDINTRNRAARRSFIGAGLTQMQQAAQVRKMEKNQIYRDAQRLGLLNDLFSDFTYSDKGWVFKQDGQVRSEDWIKKYLTGK